MPFNVGDNVWCEQYGNGVVERVARPGERLAYPVFVRFSNDRTVISFTETGQEWLVDTPTLFHRQDRLQESRPFKTGDPVWHEQFGDGVVRNEQWAEITTYPVEVEFGRRIEHFTADGRYFKNDTPVTLFHRQAKPEETRPFRPGDLVRSELHGEGVVVQGKWTGKSVPHCVHVRFGNDEHLYRRAGCYCDGERPVLFHRQGAAQLMDMLPAFGAVRVLRLGIVSTP